MTGGAFDDRLTQAFMGAEPSPNGDGTDRLEQLRQRLLSRADLANLPAPRAGITRVGR